jgi:xanthine dehydrogenase accessory factor
MNPIPETAARLLDEGRAIVLATIVSRHGSTPRTAGTRMIVTADGRIRGTIGGGLVEANVIEAVRLGIPKEASSGAAKRIIVDRRQEGAVP